MIAGVTNRRSHKLPIKVPKSCRKVAEFPKSRRKSAEMKLFFLNLFGLKVGFVVG